MLVFVRTGSLGVFFVVVNFFCTVCTAVSVLRPFLFTAFSRVVFFYAMVFFPS